MQTVVSTLFGAADTVSGQASTKLPVLKTIIRELERQPKVITVGVWDLGAQIGRLQKVIEVLNAAQSAFAIFRVEAAIPAGLISRPERLVSWFREKRGRMPSGKARKEMQNSMIEDDFYDRAEIVRKDLGLDFLIGVTPTMIAGEDPSDEEQPIGWDYFSSQRNRLLLVSAYQLRTFAVSAGRPFEVAVGCLITGQILVATNPQLEFHDETRGCLFDFNDDRISIVQGLRAIQIDDSCLDSMRPKYREVARSLVAALKGYRATED
jgi:hypothetical protein